MESSRSRTVAQYKHWGELFSFSLYQSSKSSGGWICTGDVLIICTSLEYVQSSCSNLVCPSCAFDMRNPKKGVSGSCSSNLCLRERMCPPISLQPVTFSDQCLRCCHLQTSLPICLPNEFSATSTVSASQEQTVASRRTQRLFGPG